MLGVGSWKLEVGRLSALALGWLSPNNKLLHNTRLVDTADTTEEEDQDDLGPQFLQ